MKCNDAFSSKKTRLIFLLILCLVFISPAAAAKTLSPHTLGRFSQGTIKLNYQGVTLDTYSAYGTNYIAVSDLRQLGFNVTYSASPKAITIVPSSNFQTTTSPAMQIKPNNFSFYNGTVFLGNFQTQCLVSDGRIFIPVGALSNLGTLTIANGICTFKPTSEPPVAATQSAITNLTDVAVNVTVLDVYWTNEVVTYTSNLTLLPNETINRTLNTQGNPIHIATLVQGVSGNGIVYTNNSLRGQVNTALYEKYDRIENHKLLSNYGDPIELEAVIAAEDTVNSKNLSSPTKYLVWTNISTQRTYVFTGSKNSWSLQKHFVCSTGRDRTPTPKGTYSLTCKVPSFGQNKGYCCKYAVGFIGSSYLYHSIIYDKTGSYLLENKGVLGRKASEGCIRFSTENAKWFYENMPLGTTVYIS